MSGAGAAAGGATAVILMMDKIKKKKTTLSNKKYEQMKRISRANCLKQFKTPFHTWVREWLEDLEKRVSVLEKRGDKIQRANK